MIILLLLGATLTLTPLATFAYCDPYSDDFAACTMDETSEALSRPEIDPYDYVEDPVEMQESYRDNQDFIDDYCMLEGYRAGICQ